MLTKKELISSFPTDVSGKWMRIEDVEALVDLTLEKCTDACIHAYLHDSKDSKLREEGISMVQDLIWKMRFQ